MSSSLTEQGLGWEPDPYDPRDLLHSSLTGLSGPTEGFTPVDLRHTLPDAWDQDGGECVTMGIKACFFNAHFHQLKNVKKVVPISSRLVWYRGRAERGLQKYDVGMWARQGFQHCRIGGICAEHHCPNDYPFDQQPSKLAEHYSKDQSLEHATRPHPDGSPRSPLRFARIDAPKGPERAAEVRRVMYEFGRVVVAGWKVPKRLTRDNIDPDEPFDVIEGEEMGGGHLMTLVASLESGDFLMRNSWGRGAHRNGHFVMSARMAGQGDDLWYVLDAPLLSDVSY